MPEDELRVALTLRASRRVRGDGTITVGGAEWEAEHGFLAGQTVSDALTTLHEATGGQLRDIDRVATKALRAASRRKLAKVDAEFLAGILEADQRAEARG